MPGSAGKHRVGEHRRAQAARRDTSTDFRAMIVVRTMRFAEFRLAARLASKDLRARRGRSALVVIALALSIAGISGVRGAVSAALRALEQGSRAPLAGDLSIDTGDGLTGKQYAALDELKKD